MGSDRKIAWHVQATLERLAMALKTTPARLIGLGVREDLEAFGKSMSEPEAPATPTQSSTHVSGVWETRQEAQTPVVPVDELRRKLV